MCIALQWTAVYCRDSQYCKFEVALYRDYDDSFIVEANRLSVIVIIIYVYLFYC